MMQQHLNLASDPVVSRWHQIAADRTHEVAGVINQRLRESAFETNIQLKAVEPAKTLEFLNRAAGQALPASAEVLADYIPGYKEPSTDLVEKCTSYEKQNYGSAPGPAAAFICQVASSLQPTASFVFGTGRGRIEQLITEHSEKTEVVTLDLPSELVGKAQGSPDGNNLRYRTQIGITDDSKIGDICNADPEIAGRVHQILGDSYTFLPTQLEGSMGLIVIDGNHAMPNALMDLANALELASPDGAVNEVYAQAAWQNVR